MSGTRSMTYAEAVREAMAQAMTDDDRVFLMGEDVGVYGGAFGVSNDLYERFGTDRVRDTTISELGIVGMGVGAALTGMRPIVEIQFSDFLCQAMDQVVNQAAKLHFMVGGQAEVPLVIRAPGGSGTGAAAQHSQSLEAWFAHVPGLKVVMPSNATDAGSLLLAALDDPNPVLVLEHKLLYKQSFEVPDEFPPGRLGEGRIEREGWVEQARILLNGGQTEFSRRVDRGGPHDLDVFRCDALGQELLPRFFVGRAQELRAVIHQHPVLLLGHAIVVGAQASLHMGHRHTHAPSGHGTGQGAVRIAVDEHQIRAIIGQVRPHPIHHAPKVGRTFRR